MEETDDKIKLELKKISDACEKISQAFYKLSITMIELQQMKDDSNKTKNP